MTASGDLVRVLVTVGTDVHPFDRLVGWMQRWAQGRPVELMIQFGTSTPPQLTSAASLLGHAELQSEIGRADIVVTHGGPATITEVRRRGRLPIVVPRDPRLGEHVDGHQIAFTGRLVAEGLALTAATEQELAALLDGAVADPSRMLVDTGGPDVTHRSATRLGALVDDLVRARRGDDPVTVLFIGGLGRSGSTLLDRMLGQMGDVASVGEVVHLWERGLLGDELCGCGSRFSACAFWAEVGQRAFGGWHRVDPAAVLERKRLADRTRRIPRLALPQWAAPSQSLAYADGYRRIYAAAMDASGAKLVVDSSKHASLAFNLAQHPGIDLRVLHVIRDPRGVAYSWSKSVPRPEAGQGALMHQYSARQSSTHWVAQNLALDLLARRGVTTMRVHYEDLVHDLEPVLHRIRAMAGLAADPAATRFVHDGSVELAPQHTVAGNPMRFRSGALTLVKDEQWRDCMPAGQRRLVSALTAPLRLTYGYRKGHRG